MPHRPHDTPTIAASAGTNTSTDTPAPAASLPDPAGGGLVLFQRDDCHLCDLALEQLAAAAVPDFASVFIDGDAGLEARYGVRVPVLRDQQRGRELDWPFDLARLRGFLEG